MRFARRFAPKKLFRAFNHEVRLWQKLRHPGVFQGTGMMGSIPVNRYCRQHRKAYFTDGTPKTSEGIPLKKKSDTAPIWICRQVFRYWHCASVVRFDGKREAGCLNCLCDFCPRLMSKHLFRSGSCLTGQGLYMWDGLRDVRIGGSLGKKTARQHIVREVGGRIVFIQLRDERVWYV